MAVRASREVVFEAPPEAILDALADIDQVPEWSPVPNMPRFSTGTPTADRAA